jgi:hypothetical protein
MRDDDEILEDYERELTEEPEPAPRRKRGFALVAGTLALACVFLLVEIFANRSIGNDIGTAQHDLRVAQAGAERVDAETGTFDGASADGLAAARYDGGELSYVGPDTASSGLGSVSIYADGVTWAAAIQVRPGACFYLRLDAGKDPAYGVGTVCTAREALGSKDSQW